MAKKQPKAQSTIDPQLKAAGLQNLQRAQGVANQPFKPYGGPLAPAAPQAIPQAQGIASGVGAYQPQQVNPSIARAAKVGATPDVTAGTAATASQPYANPYQSQVVDRTLADLDRFRQMALNDNSSQANMAGAWGNDRLGVENALTNEGFANQAASALANLNLTGFNTGLQFGASDADRALAAGQGNQAVGAQRNLAQAQLGQQTNLANQQVGLQGQLANQQAGLQGQGLNLQGAQTLGQLGGLQFGMEDTGMQRAYQEFLRQYQDPFMRQQMLNQTLGGFGSLSGTQQFIQPNTPWMDVLKGAAGGAGMALGMGR